MIVHSPASCLPNRYLWKYFAQYSDPRSGPHQQVWLEAISPIPFISLVPGVATAIGSVWRQPSVGRFKFMHFVLFPHVGLENDCGFCRIKDSRKKGKQHSQENLHCLCSVIGKYTIRCNVLERQVVVPMSFPTSVFYIHDRCSFCKGTNKLLGDNMLDQFYFELWNTWTVFTLKVAWTNPCIDSKQIVVQLVKKHLYIYFCCRPKAWEF